MSSQIVGKSFPRADTKEKVTGTDLYIDDSCLPRMLLLKVLRAGVPHAKVSSINATSAESMKGVYKFISRETERIDKTLLFGTRIFNESPMAFDKVRHAGEVVKFKTM